MGFPATQHEAGGRDQRRRVRSAAGPDAAAGYEASGLLAPPATERPDQVLLVVTVAYEPADETASVERQALAHLVEAE
jgi:hypothetical protein